MYFLIESKFNTYGELIPKYDWQLELINNIEYQNETRDIENQINYSLTNLTNIYSNKTIPVGSVEFVHDFMENHNIPIPPPINIPKELYSFSNLNPDIRSRKYKFRTKKENRFWKSTTQIKHPENGILDYTPSGTWQTTDLIKEGFDAEYRCFIFNNHLYDVKPYIGDWWNYDLGEDDFQPFVKKCINKYKSAPPAYTLDIGIYQRGYYILEAHNFYSCGLYGFSMPHLYPQMLSQWWYWWLKLM